MKIIFICGMLEFSSKMDKPNGNEVTKMCMILNELHNKSAADLLRDYNKNNQFPIDVARIAQDIGIQLGSVDFSRIESKDSIKKIVEQKGHILGAVMSMGEEVCIMYSNKLSDNSTFKNLTEAEKKKNCFVDKDLLLLMKLDIAVNI